MSTRLSSKLKLNRPLFQEELYREVPTSPHGDKGVCLGDTVMLRNIPMSTVLSVFSDNQKDYIVTGERPK